MSTQVTHEIQFSDYYTPHAKQLLAHQCVAPFVLFGGAMGGGKSWFLCADAIINAMQFAGNRLAIIRKELTVARRTILETFWQICPNAIVHSYNKQSLTITFINGSVLRFMEANISKDPLLNKIKGLEIGWAGLDESNELNEKVFQILKSRLRWRLPNGQKPKYRIRLTSNPENCWLVPTFIENPDDEHIFIQSLTTDNYDENSEYVQNLRNAYKNNPELLERYLGGMWTFGSAANQLILGEFIKLAHVAPSKPDRLRTMGVDVARYGDDRTTFFVILGGKCAYMESWGKTSTTWTANRVLQLAHQFSIMPTSIGVDVIGYGAGVVDILHERGFMVKGVAAGSAVVETEKDLQQRQNGVNPLVPFNLRAQMFMALRDDLADGKLGDLANMRFGGDTGTTSQLSELEKELGFIRYKIASGLKLQILRKEEIKKLYGKSPDLADAMSIANWMRRQSSMYIPTMPIIGGVL